MSASELEALAEEHKFDPLPQGWLFDGTVFIDYDGNRSTERPGELVDIPVHEVYTYGYEEKCICFFLHLCSELEGR